MAGDWIKMRSDLHTHPKVYKLAEILKMDEMTAVGALFCFWAWADKHAVDGRVDGATTRLVDRTVRVDGLADALVSIGWLSVDNSGISLPRFAEHNGDSAKERSLKNQRQARWRDRKSAGLVDEAASTSPSTPAPTREEKRREEEKNKDSGAKAPPPKFSKPSASDLIAEFSGKVSNPPNEASKFLAYYESNGWKVGRNPMKNWKSAAAGWAARSNDNATGKSIARPSKSESNATALYDYLNAIDAQEALSAGVAGSLEPPIGVGPDWEH
jgi:hypothetical protein